MNFKHYVMKLQTDLREAIAGSKAEILSALLDIAERTRQLTKTQRLDFWIEQLRAYDSTEIPMTKYGISETERNLERDRPDTRNELIGQILEACENLMLYMREGDDCSMQSQYRYYFHIPLERPFKKSELGTVSDLPVHPRPEDVRIARISELKIDPETLVP